MLKASLVSYPELDHALIGEFKIQDDVKMYSQLSDYEDLEGSDLSNEMELAAIPN